LKVRFRPLLLAFVLVILCVHDNYNVLTTIQSIATIYKVFEIFFYQASLQWSYFYNYKQLIPHKSKKTNFGTKVITFINVVNVLCKHIVVTTKNKPII
jgi:hypothetical protein